MKLEHTMIFTSGVTNSVIYSLFLVLRRLLVYGLNLSAFYFRVTEVDRYVTRSVPKTLSLML